ncbi:OmpH family outer membrane protein [Deinococcus sp. VB343]|uniref:OmpH family outer membrane protein n=1 Tax=Deinococcus sp. VB142 TaxID=3112952 RepID=A0AAU6Q548_9DEIO
MKLNRILLIAPLFLLATTPHAQQKRTRLGFVNVQKVVAAVPGGAGYLDLRKRVDTDLTKRQQNIQQLVAKANRTRAKADVAAVNKAQQSFVSAQKSHQARLAQAFKPVGTKVNGAIAAVAKSSGFSVVLDQEVAARSKLVVYANAATTDLTPAILKALKK